MSVSSESEWCNPRITIKKPFLAKNGYNIWYWHKFSCESCQAITQAKFANIPILETSIEERRDETLKFLPKSHSDCPSSVRTLETCSCSGARGATQGPSASLPRALVGGWQGPDGLMLLSVQMWAFCVARTATNTMIILATVRLLLAGLLGLSLSLWPASAAAVTIYPWTWDDQSQASSGLPANHSRAAYINRKVVKFCFKLH